MFVELMSTHIYGLIMILTAVTLFVKIASGRLCAVILELNLTTNTKW